MAIPNWKLHDITEKAGAVVVGEAMCTGPRYYRDLVSEGAATSRQVTAYARATSRRPEIDAGYRVTLG